MSGYRVNALARARQDKRWLRTNSRAWIAIRDQVLAEEPFCRCGCGGLSMEVDHIDGRSEREEDYRRENLQGLTRACHAAKTAQQKAGKEWKPRGSRVDGTPCDPNHHWNRATG